MSGHRPADYVLFGEGEFPAAECLRLLQQAGYDGWYSYEWEKAWHPEIADPDVALPPFARDSP
jgi:sugar phosphate isomerase/epimerase